MLKIHTRDVFGRSRQGQRRASMRNSGPPSAQMSKSALSPEVARYGASDYPKMRSAPTAPPARARRRLRRSAPISIATFLLAPPAGSTSNLAPPTTLNTWRAHGTIKRTSPRNPPRWPLSSPFLGRAGVPPANYHRCGRDARSRPIRARRHHGTRHRPCVLIAPVKS